MRTALAASAVLALSACASTTPATPAGAAQAVPAKGAAPADAVCNVDGLGGAVGQPATPELVQRLISDSGSRAVRVIHPGMVATMDYHVDRLNIHLDEAERIVKLTCG
ncbi:MAG: I78 family peptidase inhibitor [Pseudoxanthomonas sp.]